MTEKTNVYQNFYSYFEIFTIWGWRFFLTFKFDSYLLHICIYIQYICIVIFILVTMSSYSGIDFSVQLTAAFDELTLLSNELHKQLLILQPSDGVSSSNNLTNEKLTQYLSKEGYNW